MTSAADISERLSAVILATDAEGVLRYQPEEILDMLAALHIDLGLPLTEEMQPVLLHFYGKLPAVEDDVANPVLEGVRRYFAAHPLNPELKAAVEELSRNVVVEGQADRQQGGEAKARAAAGLAQAVLRAPAAATPTAKPAAGPTPTSKPRRGLR